MTIKPIETIYNGYRFRSRLEARWAVFFDTMGFSYEYEKEGFDLGEYGWYLPDFWLPRVKMWAEVKAIDFDDIELKKAATIAKSTDNRGFLLLVGIPSRQSYLSLEPCTCNEYNLDCWNDIHGTHGIETVLSNYHNYYKDENRFYVMPGDRDDFLYTSEDMIIGINAARQARFEFGENGRLK